MTSIHNKIILNMKKMAYRADDAGICNGIANVGMDTFLTERLDVFNEMISINETLSQDVLLMRIDRAKQHYEALYKKFKRAALAQLKFENLEKLDPEQQSLLQKKTIDLIEHTGLYEDIKPFLNVPSFFDEIELFQALDAFPQLLPEDSSVMYQDPMSVFALIDPQGPDARLPITEIKRGRDPDSKPASFSGCYNLTELKDYLTSFRETIERSIPPVNFRTSFLLTSNNHSIHIGYDPKKKNWVFIDANQLPTKKFSIQDEKRLSERVLFGFYSIELPNQKTNENEEDEIAQWKKFKNSGSVIFNTKMYVKTEAHEKASLLTAAWRQTTEMANMQEVSPSKAHLQDAYGANWLLMAAKENQVETVIALIGQGANLDLIDQHGWTALQYASAKGHTRVVELLIAAKADINAKAPGNKSLLHLAAENGHAETTDFLIKQMGEHTDISLQDACGWTPLQLAVSNGHLKAAKILLTGPNASSQKTKEGLSLLHLAASNGHLGVVLYLLANGAEKVAPDDFPAPLFFAAENGHAHVVKALIANGSNVNMKNAYGEGPLFTAILARHFNVVHALLTMGANVDDVTPTGLTCVFLAIKNGDAHTLKSLIEKNANVYDVFKGSYVELLNLAEQEGMPIHLLKRLSKHIQEHLAMTKKKAPGASANVNSTPVGFTALHAAIIFDQPFLLAQLLLQGFSPEKQSIGMDVGQFANLFKQDTILSLIHLFKEINSKAEKSTLLHRREAIQALFAMANTDNKMRFLEALDLVNKIEKVYKSMLTNVTSHVVRQQLEEALSLAYGGFIEGKQSCDILDALKIAKETISANAAPSNHQRYFAKGAKGPVALDQSIEHLAEPDSKTEVQEERKLRK